MSKQSFTKILETGVNQPLAALEARHPDGGIVFVRTALPEEVEALHRMTVDQIGPHVAPLKAMQDVHSHNPESLWCIFRSPTGDRAQAQLAGYYGFLHLNKAGLEALEKRTLTPRRPDLTLLAAAGERPEAVYVWAIVARKLTTLTLPLMARGLGIKRYGGLQYYATAATMGGLNGLKGFGFHGTSEEHDTLGDLFQFSMPGEADRASTSAA